jgi:hypothetical protein
MKRNKFPLRLYFCLGLACVVCSDSKLTAGRKNYFRHFFRWAVTNTGKFRKEYKILARKYQREPNGDRMNK